MNDIEVLLNANNLLTRPRVFSVHLKVIVFVVVLVMSQSIKTARALAGALTLIPLGYLQAYPLPDDDDDEIAYFTVR